MSTQKPTYNTYGYRFLDTMQRSFCQLFAVGFDKVTSHDYYWDGQERIDGPLYLFQYTVSGYGQVEVNEHTYQVEPGRAFMVEIPSNHRYFLPASSDEWEFYFILMRPTNITDSWKSLIDQLGPVPKLPENSSPIIFLKDVFHSASKDLIHDGYRASSIVYQFMMELHRFCHEDKKKVSTWPLTIQKAADIIEQNYNQIQSLEEISEEIGLSKYHFTRQFRKATGYTPIQYLTKVRMEKAIQLLRFADLSIEQIARNIGYANGSYFIKVFRQWVGYPPGEFKSGRGLTTVNHVKFD
ncbi:AraC family transcriptional regulator [Aquibacillus koreensis]|uniref:AraC family transcriptional regulator n=1 Tax=Aquibacillus koreensis TaxID=279446 RepID=A0A9X3WNA3_9BACI|nr:AraC family transcriptional regulator [Aquibacillus koreensis]MCT2535978.1 AraC family transcriptional regulator [Aquibacillus koreensis]MDC3420434.1 AraC family transcriptional regulator [Aquibacillus koreensis]